MLSHDFETPENRLLAALPLEDYERLLPHLERIPLASGQVLYQLGEPITDVYFPVRSLLSIDHFSHANSTFSLVGQEGMVDVSVLLGETRSKRRVVVYTPGAAIRLSAKTLKAEFDRGGALHGLLLRYVQAVFLQLSQLAACNHHHSLEQRLARQLLLIQDALQTDEFFLSLKFLARLLSASRAALLLRVCVFRRKGALDNQRGNFKIVDRQILEDHTCDCYQMMKNEFERLTTTFK
ncbi:Crp/Fnr family transcriptional regulator [Myxacorys almedinensis]|uniref:Crp/Fnr family transcriptional regulator n=1 Tax=Myxacorys almedinensis A TaxID=2690445 RepID=A0A8J7Z0X8_9CYAN|nr:Crp/Fnr family transcriptional regulator [Myxacorys almedinensis]NDJ18067.1 Crp/Fnr family transcriptional regulator [Myxacorys almedinensis A]